MELASTVYVLTGEGIECERESFKFFKKAPFANEPRYLSLYQLFNNSESFYSELKATDWVFIPGGFSFADHFGAGRLLSYRLKELAFFERLVEVGAHCMGVCNGFQVLVESEIFGTQTKLLANKRPEETKTFHFTNMWIQLKTVLLEDAIELPVRHGEGRLKGSLSEWSSLGVKQFLSYADERFDNGSDEKAAGVFRKVKNSYFWGMMPHPEIVYSKINHPDCLGPERMPRFRPDFVKEKGDGLRLLHEVFKKSSEGVV